MTRIRVDPANLRQAARQLSGIADRLRALGSEAYQITLDAPSYEGQFGPKARAMGMEAEARLRAQADRFTSLSEELEARASAFEAVDLETQVAFHKIAQLIYAWIEEHRIILAPLTGLSPSLRRILFALSSPGVGTTQTGTLQPAPFSTATPSSTPSPTATPPISTLTDTIYWGGLSEAQLAVLQQDQGGANDCGEYAIAAALNLLFGSNVQGADVAAAADQVWWPWPSKALRMWPDGPTTPQQQANIVNGIGRQAGLSLTATPNKGTTSDLINYLTQPDTAVIVTIGWDNDNIPQIARNIDRGNRAGGGAPLGLNAHAMLLVAHDPNHLDWQGDPAPWGFVNSWEDGGDEIFWMPDTDFTQAWEHSIPTVGKNNILVITNSPVQQVTSPQVQTSTPTPDTTPTLTPTPQRHPPPP